MKNKIENILLSILLGTSTLLGLSFWLNINFGFNLFYSAHWQELAQLQATHTPISRGFYVSIVIAILIFAAGEYIIYNPRPKKIKTQKKDIPQQKKETETQEEALITTPTVLNTVVARPPRLNLPKNMAQVIAQQQQNKTETKSTQKTYSQENPYAPIISQTFSENGYLVKTNPRISGFIPNLFAIGPNEVLWIGAIDVNPEDLQRAIEKLESVFNETLEDIQININGFILDTLNQYENTDSIAIFKSIDDLKTFITEHPADIITDTERENLNSYSEYIDTVIQYIKNI